MKNVNDESQILHLLQDESTRRMAFSLLVNTYSEQLYWLIRRMVLQHEDANDILQNVFLKAWNNLATFQKKSKIGTWLHRIAVNECIDFLRSQKQNISVDDNQDKLSVADTLMSDTYFDGTAAQAKLYAAIATLPEVQRAVFNLRYFDDLGYAEISEMLNTSVGSLKASYHLAVKKIKSFLENCD